MPNMMKNIKRYPLTSTARLVLAIALVINIITLIVILYYAHAIADYRTSLVVIPGIFFAVVAIIALVLKYRYALLDRYPYLINLPAFAWRLGAEKDPKTLGQIVNRIFTVHTLAALYISILGLTETYWVFAFGNKAYVGLLFSMIIVIVVAFVLSLFALYRNIYRDYTIK